MQIPSSKSDDAIAYQCHGNNVGPMGTLRRGNGGVTGGVPFTVAFHENSRGELRTTEIAGCLSTGGGKSGQGYPAIAFDWQTAGSERTRPNISTERTSTIQCTNRDAIMVDCGVRRLTPLECERLQGYPDEYTEGQSDAQRYRQMGNSVAIPVVERISRRLVEVDQHGSIGVLGQAA